MRKEIKVIKMCSRQGKKVRGKKSTQSGLCSMQERQLLEIKVRGKTVVRNGFNLA